MPHTTKPPAWAPVVFPPLDEPFQGVDGPYGRVQVHAVGDELLPVRITTRDRSADADFTRRTPSVRLGTGPRAVTLTAAGVRFGSGSRRAVWTAATVHRLITTIARDPALTRAVMGLRAALHTGYPVARAHSRADATGLRTATVLAAGSASFGQHSTVCTPRRETTTREVVTLVEIVKSAEEQYQECYDRQATRSPCNAFSPLAGVCAAGVCALTAFADLVVGFLEVITTVTEEVVRIAVACLEMPKGWPNPWQVLPPSDLLRGVAQPATPPFTTAQLGDAVKLVKGLVGFLGPLATALLEGTWSLTQLDTPIDVGDGPLVLPYGARVCLSATSARTLTGITPVLALGDGWASAMTALAALSTSFATSVAPLGVVVPAGLAALVAAASPAVIVAAQIILAFVVLAMIYGTALVAQLTVHEWIGSFDDGRVCLEHPTIALAMIKLATLTLVPAELVPPIVTG